MTITNGVIEDVTKDIDTTLTSSANAIPTSEAVYNAIEDVKITWTTLN